MQRIMEFLSTKERCLLDDLLERSEGYDIEHERVKEYIAYQYYLIEKYKDCKLENGGLCSGEDSLFSEDYLYNLEIHGFNAKSVLKGQFKIGILKIINDVLRNCLRIMAVSDPDEQLKKIDLMEDVTGDDHRRYYYYRTRKLLTVYRRDENVFLIQNVSVNE